MFKKAKLILFFIALTGSLSAQNGLIRGTVYDGETGETMPFTSVAITGTTLGTATDLDGQFTLSVPPGIYSLEVSFIAYAPSVITDIKVEPGETVVFDEITLQVGSLNLSEVTVTAEAAKRTEAALLNVKKKSANLIDGVSAAKFKQTGDSDAAASMKRVPGVSVEGGKYVFVRGLGDRYTKTLLNGLDVPGLDPDRNTIQMDIFPTSIIENIIVNKTFVADLPADFTGGVIDINLKEFPESRSSSFGASIGYNPNFHFQSDYLTYEGGSLDWIGFDDGTREIPATENIPQFAEAVGNPNGQKGTRYQEILQSFNPVMGTIEQMSFMNFGFDYDYGNQTQKEDYTLGYTFAFSYSNETEYYKDVIYGRYGLDADPSVTEMDVRENQTGRFGINNIFLSGLAGIALKTKTSKYSLKVLHLQNGESKAGIFNYFNSDQGAIFEGIQHNLEYSQRSLTHVFMSGKHHQNDSPWTIEWKAGPTFSSMDDPDVRFTRYEIRNDNFVIGTEAGFPQRIWRDLQEINVSSNLDLSRKYQALGSTSKLKFGARYTFKNRDYNIRSFNLNIRDLTLTGDPDELFEDQNLWPNAGINSGTTFDAVFLPVNPNEFNSKVSHGGIYVSTEVQASARLKAIIGLRGELYQQFYTGQNQLGTIVLNNDEVLNDVNLFPTVNLVYGINENQNLRFSYSSTIARPSLKELSYAEIFDPLTSRTFIGGLFKDEDPGGDNGAGITYWDGNLISTTIQNLDVRYEIFQEGGSTISVGAFYKYFKNPIEIVQFVTQAAAFQPRNVGDATLIGGEFELRQNLAIINAQLRDWEFSANVTYTQSRIELSATEYESRVNNARQGQEIDRYRPMAGQAPLIINTGFAYIQKKEGIPTGFQAGIYYNVQSSTLQFVGIVDRPDIYTVPFHSLNINSAYAFGKENQYRVKFKVTNLLNDRRESVFQSFQAQDQFFTSLAPGTTFSLGFSVKL